MHLHESAAAQIDGPDLADILTTTTTHNRRAHQQDLREHAG